MTGAINLPRKTCSIARRDRMPAALAPERLSGLCITELAEPAESLGT
ncbi:Hypothetical protein A7982_01666 [Minicystis rosea]|nr:Hypothetical protein A7982_01666 [Minicystis rosea]